MSDDRVAVGKPFFDASALLLVDTRASQSLEPIRLPAKLRERIDRAQRRANAAKEGLSIFTKESKDAAVPAPTATAGRRIATAPPPETTTASIFGGIADPHRASTANGGMDDKMHLPNVVLSHKMRDFEARANAGGNVVLFSADAADRSLQGLSLEDRERVMLVMQTKIRQIASDVDANFARITKALDANGIFDSTANIQRAQTLCLVDLQRRCKLDKLRDEAMREVLNLSTSVIANQKTPVNPARKLSQLLGPTTRRKSAEATAAALNSTTTRRKRKPVRAAKLPALFTSGKSVNEKSNNQISSSPQDHQQNSGNIDNNKDLGVTRVLTRRGGLAPPASASQTQIREEVGWNTVATSNKNANDWELSTRHSHVTQILQSLVAGETPNTKTLSTFNANSAEADMDHSRVLNPVDEWTQRPASYQAVGARSTEAVRKCGGRQRWDTLGHFRKKSFRAGQQRDQQMYAELQANIRERLIASERRTRTAAAAVRSVRTSRQKRLPQTAPVKIKETSYSTASLPFGQLSPPRGDQLQPLQDEVYSPILGISVSTPVLSSTMEGSSELPSSSSSQKHSRFGSRVRRSVLELKLMRDPSLLMSRHGRGKESLIGVPHTQLGNKSIGRHSEARIAYRRDTAQTWAWHHSPESTPNSAVDTIAEDEDERDEDRFNEEGYDHNDKDCSEEGDDREDGTEDGDGDAESVDSSRTSTGNRKQGKSKRLPTVQRRASRSAANRSTANTLAGHALSLHARLEVIWRVLHFPYSNKLTMLERLSTLQDADAFESVLEHWERVTPLIAIRQRMKLALSGYAERGELRPSEWLTQSEIALIQNHSDAVTLQIQKLANDLKTHTGEELQFRGHPYPRR
ncbi:uncharacterized protein PITG_18651 [Phytophthora infestans T30-4]|uniref:Uncharacterized protein n=1 Tax=Phytophthora infestans (strain T30-4) TaxID=403677 RepID=D0NYK7_PHYIT|nr:uncharacterized protein PITG_18651 [Phytophthora infestans T30-4]EEY68627.1 conserved hypothetical protein [Phytophthora infestans T30-4]|eukprot:XP_002997557.1 conserved hypothetical protein [Phytophthora infestans T30-4]